jgi:DNA-binding CsgD family transcriptional regulator
MEVLIADEEATASRLTPSELGVLHAAANGLTVSESARRLGKSSETVKTQRRGIIQKFGARNIVQVVGIATARGILRLDAEPLTRQNALRAAGPAGHRPPPNHVGGEFPDLDDPWSTTDRSVALIASG